MKRKRAKRRKKPSARVLEVMRWFRHSVTCEGEAYVIDAEQAEAVADESLNTIVVARAGSGKTRTIVAKMVYLIAQCGVKPEEIMTFVFNANAAKEINERLSKMRVEGVPVVEKSKIATTFHAFARKVVYEACGGKEKCGKILAGEKEAFILEIVRRMLREKNWREKIVWFIKGDSGESDGMMDEKEIEGFAKMMVQFVNRAQQKYLGGEVTAGEVAREYLENEEVGMRERVFVELGVECFKRYHWYLLDAHEGLIGFSEYGTDFNLIVSWASKLIVAERGSVRKWLSGKRWILIDEYQDFSQLFLAAVEAVRGVAKEARLFVVGDDWQAINRFAGSEVEYFKEFEKYFLEDYRRFEITTNYRCGRAVVNTARKFMMKGMGEKGKFRAFSRKVGRVVLVDAKRSKMQYLEMLVQLVKKNRKTKDIMILHRNNETNLKISLAGLGAALKREVVKAGVMTMEEYDAKVRVMTMHKSKGLEAEVVIILEADEGIIPKTHPDTRLYGMFGETEEVALNDQKRLFYVAMTRAKKRLYIMHDDSSGTGFVKYLGRGVERWEG